MTTEDRKECKNCDRDECFEMKCSCPCHTTQSSEAAHSWQSLCKHEELPGECSVEDCSNKPVPSITITSASTLKDLIDRKQEEYTQFLDRIFSRGHVPEYAHDIKATILSAFTTAITEAYKEGRRAERRKLLDNMCPECRARAVDLLTLPTEK